MMKLKANLKKRIFATILDYSLIFVSTFTYIIFFGAENENGKMEVTGFKTLVIPIVWFIYFVVIEAEYGATLGHNSFNLKVMTLDKKDIDFTHALKRHLLDPIDILFYGIPAFIAVKYSVRHQRLGDMWAQTIVVDTLDPEQQPYTKYIKKTS